MTNLFVLCIQWSLRRILQYIFFRGKNYLHNRNVGLHHPPHE